MLVLLMVVVVGGGGVLLRLPVLRGGADEDCRAGVSLASIRATPSTSA